MAMRKLQFAIILHCRSSTGCCVVDGYFMHHPLVLIP